MKTITISMPLVSACYVTKCAYHVSANCHARAITIGDGTNPACDTYLCLQDPGEDHVKPDPIVAGVGACKVQSCRHNQRYECMADEISVGNFSDRVNCLTYSPS